MSVPMLEIVLGPELLGQSAQLGEYVAQAPGPGEIGLQGQMPNAPKCTVAVAGRRSKLTAVTTSTTGGRSKARAHCRHAIPTRPPTR